MVYFWTFLFITYIKIQTFIRWRWEHIEFSTLQMFASILPRRWKENTISYIYIYIWNKKVIFRVASKNINLSVQINKYIYTLLATPNMSFSSKLVVNGQNLIMGRVILEERQNTKLANLCTWWLIKNDYRNKVAVRMFNQLSRRTNLLLHQLLLSSYK